MYFGRILRYVISTTVVSIVISSFLKCPRTEDGLFAGGENSGSDFRRRDTLSRRADGRPSIPMNQPKNFSPPWVSLTCGLRVGVDAARFSIHQLVRVPVVTFLSHSLPAYLHHVSLFLSSSHSLLPPKGRTTWRSDEEKGKRERKERAGFSGFPPPQPRDLSPLSWSSLVTSAQWDAYASCGTVR